MDVTHRALFLAATAFALSGCATTRGGPQSVFDSAALVKMARSYSVEAVDVKIDELDSDQAEQKRYRNKVIRAYLTAIDSQFFQFRSNLGLEGRGSALGFDLLTLGLATAGSLSMGAAPELAAAAGVATGSRAAIDKNLLFEKTLPALFASMDAARLRQRTLIIERMQEDYGNYPMEAAWNDLQTYQIAGTVDDAVSQITDSAASDRSTARAAYNRSRGVACDAPDDIIDVTDRLRDRIDAAETDAASADRAVADRGRAKIVHMASVFDVESAGRPNDVIINNIIGVVSLDYCKTDILRHKIDLLLP